jgi:3-oxoacyl-(acyl-carrier-protein) synthase
MEKRRIRRPVIVACDMLTPYGPGVDACRKGLYSGITAIKEFGRFDASSLQSGNAAMIESLIYLKGESLVMQMVNALFSDPKSSVPQDAKALVATTKGEVDLLEKMILDDNSEALYPNLAGLPAKIADCAGVRDRGMIISAACASSSAAVARAALMITGGRTDCVLVVACDSVTEFVYAGFSSLMALDKVAAKPFDKKRSGLSLGEAAAYCLIMSRERAVLEEREIVAEISGWGLSDDANHMTGPSRTSEGMIIALKSALNSSGCKPADVAFISAHGTGTVYNDQMEMRAYKAVLSSPVPLYGIKGAIGHSLGAAGMVELIIAADALRQDRVPPTVNLNDVDDDASGWASSDSRKIDGNKTALVANAGFSGINTVLALARGA